MVLVLTMSVTKNDFLELLLLPPILFQDLQSLTDYGCGIQYSDNPWSLFFDLFHEHQAVKQRRHQKVVDVRVISTTKDQWPPNCPQIMIGCQVLKAAKLGFFPCLE